MDLYFDQQSIWAFAAEIDELIYELDRLKLNIVLHELKVETNYIERCIDALQKNKEYILPSGLYINDTDSKLFLGQLRIGVILIRKIIMSLPKKRTDKESPN